METKTKLSVRDMAYIAMFAVIMAVCSWISVPYVVPFTLQTFAVFLAVGVLGGKRGTLAVLIYILLGCVGLPVFAGFSGGIGVVLGCTGSYIAGFLCGIVEGLTIDEAMEKGAANATETLKYFGAW